MRICVYAKQTGGACDGSVYSRKIACEAGEANTCLRNCSVNCPLYEPVSQAVIAAKSAEILSVRQETLEQITKASGKQAVNDAKMGSGRPTGNIVAKSDAPTGGCGCNGNNLAAAHIASSGGSYIG